MIRAKLRHLRERCCPASKYKYVHIEDDIVSTPNWPPVGDDPITAVYKDGRDQSFSQASESDRMLPSTSDSNNCSASGVSLVPVSSRTSCSQSDGYLESSSSIYESVHEQDHLGNVDSEHCSTIEEKGEHSGNGVSADEESGLKGEHSGNGVDSSGRWEDEEAVC